MMYLKKYFTEGLVQVAILLSLFGDNIQDGPYLPSWREMISGPTSALTQTQLHNLRNQQDSQSRHLKNVDLDSFFGARGLLGWVRRLDHFRVPGSEFETWLVRREPDALVIGAPGQPASLDGGTGGLDDHSGDPVGSPDLGYGPIRDNGLETMAAVSRRGQEEEADDDLQKEDTETRQGHSNAGHNERPEQILEESGMSELVGNTWREGWRDYYDHANRELAQDLSDQVASLEAQSSMSLQECLRLMDDAFPYGEGPESDPVDLCLSGARGEDPSHVRQPLLSPLLSHADPSMDLEQQWQDILAIMEPEDTEVDFSRDAVMQSGSIEGPGAMDHDRQDIVPGSSLDSYSFSPSLNDGVHLGAPLQPTSVVSDNLPSTFNLIDTALPLPFDGSVGSPTLSHQSGVFLEEPVQPSPLASLLDDALLDEISFLGLALEEGFNPTQASELEEELDTDSGLSLNFSHSPASPCESEVSSYSSSSSSSSSSESSASPSEGAVGYNSDMEAILDPEEGAAGGYSPEVSKMCSTSYQNPGRYNNLPWLEQVGHDHNYHQPRADSRNQRKPFKSQKSHYSKPYDCDIADKMWGRDERQARALKIPFSNNLIVNMPVEEFNELLTKHHLSEAQLNLIRDIRRRGKNKMAAQNCRRRKLDILFGLEDEVAGFRRQKVRLLKEKTENLRSVREMKQRLNCLYQEVFSRLRDEQPLSASNYTIQFGNDGQVLLVTNNSSTKKKKAYKKQDRRK
ncbi:hypothetical protein DPEC_G00276110 [Dallia pectoralis]|uniref:Uncharacterized protein n=1 Tax=Dallia pectoralis TaxID=75939 RepID=A0ACC2FLS8_DALPE|nr:hypothetical protein DPEC_G00276110 [Dallia pectoralis]